MRKQHCIYADVETVEGEVITALVPEYLRSKLLAEDSVVICRHGRFQLATVVSASIVRKYTGAKVGKSQIIQEPLQGDCR